MQPDSPTSRRPGSPLAVVLLTVSSFPALAANPNGLDGWRFDAKIYGWAAGIGADLNRSGAAWIGFDRILDDLDMAFMGAFAASKGKWRFDADVIYMKLSENDSAALTVPNRTLHRCQVLFLIHVAGWPKPSVPLRPGPDQRKRRSAALGHKGQDSAYHDG
jgi:hypothetical protein